MANENNILNIGDIISLKGSNVPRSLEKAYWKVVGFWIPTEKVAGTYALDGPYCDPACEVRFNGQKPDQQI